MAAPTILNVQIVTPGVVLGKRKAKDTKVCESDIGLRRVSVSFNRTISRSYGPLQAYTASSARGGCRGYEAADFAGEFLTLCVLMAALV